MSELYNVVFIGFSKNINENQMGSSINGSGLILEGKRVITCAHVYNEIIKNSPDKVFAGISENNNLKFKKYKSYDLTLIAKNDSRDIAVLQIQDPKNELEGYGYSVDSFATEKEVDDLKTMTDIYFYGFPLANEFIQMNMGVTLMTSRSVIGSVKYSAKDGKVDFILIDKATNPGSSGSPVFCNEKIIGLASATFNKTHKIGESLIDVPIGVGLVRPSNYILELLNE